MVITLYQKQHAKGDFNGSEIMILMREMKDVEDAELQAILDEDEFLSQNQMAAMLNVAKQTISARLKAMEKTQKC
ncbi:hypothetical protein TNCT_602931 [Trichonephila clavata]|uniref:Uncharacterized protein n=1 Tax=Trichonephila clavata TaxID=2740835 RepID=A0A8X6LZN8_TRICU|nr:hypothetical protein TNCT_602931 [Trichonephila clavata]